MKSQRASSISFVTLAVASALLSSFNSFSYGFQFSLSQPQQAQQHYYSTRLASTTTPPSDVTSTNTSSTPSSSNSVRKDEKIEANERQPKYGNDLPMVETYAKCGRCQAYFAVAPQDLGTRGKGCRVGCGLCGHSWYQARDKLFTAREGYELTPFLENDIQRVKKNVKEGRDPTFTGTYKLYVGNLDFKTTEEELIEFFSSVDEEGSSSNVGECNIVTGQDGRSRGFAFVTMMTDEAGEKALELNGQELNGRNLQVKPPNN